QMQYESNVLRCANPKHHLLYDDKLGFKHEAKMLICREEWITDEGDSTGYSKYEIIPAMCENRTNIQYGCNAKLIKGYNETMMKYESNVLTCANPSII
ncbi:hypothetical protein PMAYCL1PPCAC_08645, partial [Pristionchus mayeri]